MYDLKQRLTDAIERRPDADTEIFQFWSDKRLEYNVIAETVNSDGVAVMFRIDADIDAEFWQLSWEELEQGLSEWRALDDKLASERRLPTAAD